MILYLIQHGEAKREEEDPTRPLSEKGVEDVKTLASFLSRLGVKVEELLHSNKLRARQTAEILANSLRLTKDISEADGLAPLDDPSIWTERLKGKKESLMLVGHLPHLGKLLSFLLSGDKEKTIIAFKMGSAVCMKKDDTGAWTLQWMITPEII